MTELLHADEYTPGGASATGSGLRRQRLRGREAGGGVVGGGSGGRCAADGGAGGVVVDVDGGHRLQLERAAVGQRLRPRRDRRRRLAQRRRVEPDVDARDGGRRLVKALVDSVDERLQLSALDEAAAEIDEYSYSESDGDEGRRNSDTYSVNAYEGPE